MTWNPASPWRELTRWTGGLAAAAVVLSACGAAPTRDGAPGGPGEPAELPVQELALAGPAAAADAELSGLAWHGEELILLPERLGLAERGRRLVPGEQWVYALAKADIVAAVDGRRRGPLVPRAIPVVPDVSRLVEGLDGFEAIAIDGDDAFLTIETYQNADGTNPGYVLRGAFRDGRLELEPASLRVVARPTSEVNTGFEAATVAGGHLYVVYERNREAEGPRAAVFDAADLSRESTAAFPALAYRVTDLTAPDAEGRVWAMNYRYSDRPIDAPPPEDEPLMCQYGRGATHRREIFVERLVELDLRPEGFALTPRAPLLLALGRLPRNWEGLARLDDRGLLLVTDEHPRTILAFVALPSP